MKIIDSYPDWIDSTKGGVFKDLTAHIATFPWLSNSAILDIEYFGNLSGDKTVSVLVDRFIDINIKATVEHPQELTASQRAIIANIIANKFQAKWTKLYALLSKQYNPIENYSMTETETPNISRKHQVSADYKETSERKINTDLTVETDNNTNQGIFGFNSGESVPTGTADTNGTVTTSGDAEDNTETTEHTQQGYTEDTETGTRSLTRSGNIGVTTSQQMMQSEIDLWQWNFFAEVFKDVDTVLTTPKFEI